MYKVWQGTTSLGRGRALMNMIDVGLKKYEGIMSWMALHRRPRFGLRLADNASDASYGKH